MPATPTWVPSAPGLVEAPDSGEVNYDDVATLTQIYQGKYVDCLAAALPKGVVGSGDTVGLYVKTCKVTKSRGEIGRLTIVWSGYAGGGEEPQIPADKFGLRPVEFNPAVERSPKFADLYNDAPDSDDIELQDMVTQSVQGATQEERDDAYQGILDSIVSESVSALKVANLLRRGTNNYYQAAFRYYWVLFSLEEPSVTLGGYLETPGGPLSSLIGSLSLSCLRESDDLTFEDGFYVLTRSWLCAPDSHWSTDLYAP